MNYYYNERSDSAAYVRVLHAVPNAPNVDVYANDKMIAKNLSYGQYTQYKPVLKGNYEIVVYAAGTKSNPVVRNTVMMESDSVKTIAVTGTLETIGLMQISDAGMMLDSNKSMVRFMHLSPNAPAVDITLPDGTVIFGNVSYQQITPYTAVPPMKYTLQVRLAGTSTVVLTVSDVELNRNQFYTIYAIGLAGGTPGLEALLLVDGK